MAEVVRSVHVARDHLQLLVGVLVEECLPGLAEVVPDRGDPVEAIRDRGDQHPALATGVRQGRALIDAAAAAGLGHLVLTTVAHADRRVDIAPDERTPTQLAEILADTIGRPITHAQVPLAQVRQRSTDLAAMFDYFSTVGLTVDVAALHRDYPEVGWHSFADWALAQDWPALLSETRARP